VGGKLGAPSMRAPGLFREFSQKRRGAEPRALKPRAWSDIQKAYLEAVELAFGGDVTGCKALWFHFRERHRLKQQLRRVNEA
jgi:hypothetical protein